MPATKTHPLGIIHEDGKCDWIKEKGHRRKNLTQRCSWEHRRRRRMVKPRDVAGNAEEESRFAAVEAYALTTRPKRVRLQADVTAQRLGCT